jgi:hypothetical protein
MLSASSSFSKEALLPAVPVLIIGSSCESMKCTNFEIFLPLLMKSTVQNIPDSYTAGYSHHFIKTECGNTSLQHSERIIVIAIGKLSER